MKKILITTLLILAMITTSASAMTVTYTPLGVPNINSSFKTWMDYRCITCKTSAQYKLGTEWGWTDSQGFRRVNGERDLGITDDYYMIALGPYYGTTMGTKYRFTTDKGKVFYGILSEAKGYGEYNATGQYGMANKDIVECLIDENSLNRLVMQMGSANWYEPLSGRITKIERIDFVG